MDVCEAQNIGIQISTAALSCFAGLARLENGRELRNRKFHCCSLISVCNFKVRGYSSFLFVHRIG